MSATTGFVIAFILLFVFMAVGRAIIMWYTGTDQIVKNQKKIIELLTEIADNTQPAEPLQKRSALIVASDPRQRRPPQIV